MPDEVDKKIAFILDMQTQFETNMGKLASNLARCETNIDKLRDSVVDLAGVVRESAKLSDERFTRLDQRMLELADAHKTTDERLNALISVVERHITGPDHAPRP
jgi:hypothetical protein